VLALPVDPYVDEIAGHLRRSRAVVVTALPGAGKTTRVPPALLSDGPVILLQPRRVAARAIASRIAEERGWTAGREVGWQVRFERRFTADTRLLVVTEGVLTARLQNNPLLSDFRTIVFDEFHERSIHGDLAIALAKQAWRARDDLRIVVMSATLDTAPVAAFLDGCPVVDVPGRVHPTTIGYAPDQAMAAAAVDVLGHTDGDLLCFLPGAAEIRRTIDDLQQRLDGAGIDVLPLHGSLDAPAQDAAIRLSSRRRIVVATNIAETSLTVPGVSAVIDSGLQKIARYDSDRGIDSLNLERITADAADQRAGRAARLGPGIVRRLWDARDRLRPHREPEIHRVDLSGPLLDVLAWGGDPRRLEWFERPREDAIDHALVLLDRLGLIQDGILTALGDQVRCLPLHPRLARMLVAAGCSREMAYGAALLSERQMLPPRRASTTSDLLSVLDEWHSVPAHVQRVAHEIESLCRPGSTAFAPPALRRVSPKLANDLEGERKRKGPALNEIEFRKAVLAGYPDRVARRREPGSARVQLASGAGAVVGPESGVIDGEFLVALDVQAPSPRSTPGGAGPARTPGDRGPGSNNEARIRLASRVEREWLPPNASEVEHRFDSATGTVKAAIVERYDALVLAERPVKPDPGVAAALLADAWRERGPDESDARLLARLRFAGREVEMDDLVRAAVREARSLNDVRLARVMPGSLLHDLEREAPDAITVPSGRTVRLEYGADGVVSAAVKLQELFGLGDSPRIGRRREPVLLALLAPNGRPVQLTRDLRSFWDRTYPEVRRELRGRYPRHPWPDDPWTAPPTRRVKPGHHRTPPGKKTR
jgi:ATP-dependent helicase HrpB